MGWWVGARVYIYLYVSENTVNVVYKKWRVWHEALLGFLFSSVGAVGHRHYTH